MLRRAIPAIFRNKGHPETKLKHAVSDLRSEVRKLKGEHQRQYALREKRLFERFKGQPASKLKNAMNELQDEYQHKYALREKKLVEKFKAQQERIIKDALGPWVNQYKGGMTLGNALRIVKQEEGNQYAKYTKAKLESLRNSLKPSSYVRAPRVPKTPKTPKTQKTLAPKTPKPMVASKSPTPATIIIKNNKLQQEFNNLKAKYEEAIKSRGNINKIAELQEKLSEFEGHRTQYAKNKENYIQRIANLTAKLLNAEKKGIPAPTENNQKIRNNLQKRVANLQSKLNAYEAAAKIINNKKEEKLQQINASVLTPTAKAEAIRDAEKEAQNKKENLKKNTGANRQELQKALLLQKKHDELHNHVQQILNKRNANVKTLREALNKLLAAPTSINTMATIQAITQKLHDMILLKPVSNRVNMLKRTVLTLSTHALTGPSNATEKRRNLFSRISQPLVNTYKNTLLHNPNLLKEELQAARQNASKLTMGQQSILASISEKPRTLTQNQVNVLLYPAHNLNPFHNAKPPNKTKKGGVLALLKQTPGHIKAALKAMEPTKLQSFVSGGVRYISSIKSPRQLFTIYKVTQNLKHTLSNFEVKKISGDGSCLFGAIAASDPTFNTRQVRQLVLNKTTGSDLKNIVQTHPHLFKENMSNNQKLAVYIGAMQQNSCFGGDSEMIKYSEITKRPIIVLNEKGGELVRHVPKGSSMKNAVYLLYTRDHFNALIPKTSKNNQVQQAVEVLEDAVQKRINSIIQQINMTRFQQLSENEQTRFVNLKNKTKFNIKSLQNSPENLEFFLNTFNKIKQQTTVITNINNTPPEEIGIPNKKERIHINLRSTRNKK